MKLVHGVCGKVCVHGVCEEYVNGDSDLPVCVDVDDNSWESTFFLHLCQEDEEGSEDENDDQDEGTVDDEPPLKVTTYNEANKFLEEAQRFLENQGHLTEALKIGSIVDNVSQLQLVPTRQIEYNSSK